MRVATTAKPRNALHAVTTAAIAVNIPVAVVAEIVHDEMLERVDHALLLFFVAEVSVRLVHAVRRRHADVWLVVDSVIILAAMLLPVGLMVARSARVAHMLRHAAHVRHHAIPIVRLVRAAA